MICEQTNNLQDSVLTIGCHFRPVRGGIAQVLASYESWVFDGRMKFIADSRSDCTKLGKLMVAIVALLRMIVCIKRDKHIRIVHIHSASGNSFRRSAVFAKVARWMGCKVLIHIHGGRFKEYASTRKDYVSRVLSNCDKVIALSESWRKFLVDDLHFFQTEVVPNIVEKPSSEYIRKEDGLVHALFLGTLVQSKGIYDLLEAIFVCNEHLSGKFMLTIGGLGEEKKLTETIEKYGISHMVNYIGWVSGREKQKVLAQSDFFVLPSYAEGLPISILEAMSYSLPVVSTNVGGIPEVVDDKNGFLFMPGDKQALSHALVLLTEDAEKRKTLGQAGKVKVRSFYSDAVRENLESIYKELLCTSRS